MSTCLAMILDVPVEQVIAEFHEAYFAKRTPNSITPLIYLHSKGVVAIPQSSENNTLYWGRLYLLCVPSLNTVAANHSILADLTDEGNFRLYDPAQGYVSRFYYIPKGAEDDHSNAVELEAYTIDYEIIV